MAKRGKTGILGLFAFAAMILNAISWILKACKVTGNILGLMEGISSFALVIVALVVAYDYAKRQSSIWRIIYWILTVLTLGSILFGVGKNFVA